MQPESVKQVRTGELLVTEPTVCIVCKLLGL